MQRDVNIDRVALAALGAIGVGWFLMTTLVVNFGLWQESIRFYDVWAVIQDPGGRLSGINRAHALTTLGFGLVCAAAILAPAISIFYQRKDAWLTYLVPFVVMAISCAVLYTKSSTSYFPTDRDSNSASAFLARIAQAAITRAGDTVASRISIGAGAYVAMFCSCFLALRGLSRLRVAATRADPVESGIEGLAPRRQRNASTRQIEP
jgi:hypothetical protein